MAGARATQRDAEFGEYYASRAGAMRATAYLLCGDWHLAEDLVQTAFTKLYLAWHRVFNREAPDQYLRRVILRSFLDERRRPWRRERSTAEFAALERASPEPLTEERLVLLEALAAVPARQRATLVLRFWEDLSVEESAELLGVSTGTVKSQTARGLKALRDVLEQGAPAGVGTQNLEWRG